MSFLTPHNVGIGAASPQKVEDSIAKILRIVNKMPDSRLSFLNGGQIQVAFSIPCNETVHLLFRDCLAAVAAFSKSNPLFQIYFRRDADSIRLTKSRHGMIMTAFRYVMRISDELKTV